MELIIEHVRESQRCPFCFFVLFVLIFMGKGSFRERRKEEWQPLKFCLDLFL